eukprot:TRINITY_DN542_c0_g1_i12.p1 TRINITY_DN542_c0_g1~~TRINITY_DN542_c0_g1_i12.p1  ORF type:complete len:249 (-),score=8.57 TRINITY_DN542_c0_g1_i12:421-1167(-)
MMNYTQLPTCPLCIEKLDSSVTGIYYEMITRTFAYENQNRWKDARATCIVCSKTKNPTLSKASSRVDDNGQRNTQSEEDCARCSICLDAENTWICMICGYCGCGRYKYGHAIDHYFCTRHALTIHYETNRIWDYERDIYVHRLIRSKEFLLLNLPDTNEESNPGNEKLMTANLRNNVSILIKRSMISLLNMKQTHPFKLLGPVLMPQKRRKKKQRLMRAISRKTRKAWRRRPNCQRRGLSNRNQRSRI